jgi:hypothetical protein
MCALAHSLLKPSSRTICFLTSGSGLVVMICSGAQRMMEASARERDTYLEGKHRLPPLQHAPGHGSTSTLSQASELLDSLLHARHSPSFIV